MDFQVIHPREPVRGRDYDSAQLAAIRAEDHVPKPNDLRMNLFADASPNSKRGIGGVGICYGRWLPTQPVCMGNAISFVVPTVKDSNECELVALAGATLEVINQIQENIQIMTENGWKTSVTIWSDSQNALKFLEDPRQFQRFGPGRPTQVRNLILKLFSEMKNLPIQYPVKFNWIPGLSTGMHCGADHMTKNETVKAGKADNISRAMKMLFHLESYEHLTQWYWRWQSFKYILHGQSIGARLGAQATPMRTQRDFCVFDEEHLIMT